MNNLSDAFKQLDCLNEDTFEVTPEGIEELQVFKDEDNIDDVVDIIDINVDDEEDLEDSYIGKVICQCDICKSLVYFDKNEITVDEDSDTVNNTEECPYCFSSNCFKVIGEVSPFSKIEVETDDDVEVKVNGKKVSNESKSIKESVDAEDFDGADDFYGLCDSCGAEFHSEREIKYGPQGEPLCSDCYGTEVFACDGCGKDFYFDDLTPTDDQELYCDDCLNKFSKHGRRSGKMKINEFKKFKFTNKSKSKSIKESVSPVVRPGWAYWELPDDYEDPFEYPYYFKEFDGRYTGIIYPPYKSDNPRIDGFEDYYAELYDNETEDEVGDSTKAFRDFKSAERYVKKMYQSVVEDNKDIEDDEDLKEFINIRGNRMRRLKRYSESLDSIKLDDGAQEIEIKTKEKDEQRKATMIIPPSDDTIKDILTNEEDIIPEDGDEVEADIDEIDEESFDDLAESYLKKVYENVRSFKTVKAYANENNIKLEGIIKFNSGKTKRTSFIFESSTINSKGRVKFLGENKDIARGKKSFTMYANIRHNKLLPESMTYNYRAKLQEGRSTKVYGTVKLNEGLKRYHR